jgi:hypothetical protein
MRYSFILFVLMALLNGCRKADKSNAADCFPGITTVRQIVNKQAVIKLTATAAGVYLVEQGSIDSKLIPCNLPMEFYHNDLLVTISGEVKLTSRVALEPCCSDNFVITKISR